MDAEAFVELPHTQENWANLKAGLTGLAEKKIKGLEAFEEFLSKNDRWESLGTPFSLLRKVLSDGKHFTEEFFCETLLPWIAGEALRVEELFKDENRLPNLHKGRADEVTLTRQQVCCLLALCFFHCFPPPKKSTYQHFTLALFFSFAFYASQGHKLLCILYYFDRLRAKQASGNKEFLSMCITVARHHLKDEDPSVAWGECGNSLTPFNSPTDGSLIEAAHGCLQVDFANAYIGGGVLHMGNVQEEIRFCINPECLVSILFCEEMEDSESILITGAEQFTAYTGYGGSFKCTGPYEDTNPLDDRNQRRVNILAIDATPFDHSSIQYQKMAIVRELNKAYSGFSHQLSDDKPGHMTTVATGNWGCGMFGGNKRLKMLLQWMVASRVGRPVQYHTFREPELVKELMEVARELIEKKVTVAQLYKILTSGEKSLQENVFETVLKLIGKTDSK